MTMLAPMDRITFSMRSHLLERPDRREGDGEEGDTHKDED